MRFDIEIDHDRHFSQSISMFKAFLNLCICMVKHSDCNESVLISKLFFLKTFMFGLPLLDSKTVWDEESRQTKMAYLRS